MRTRTISARFKEQERCFRREEVRDESAFSLGGLGMCVQLQRV